MRILRNVENHLETGFFGGAGEGRRHDGCLHLAAVESSKALGLSSQLHNRYIFGGIEAGLP